MILVRTHAGARARPRRRRGYVLLEVAMAVVLLLAAMALAVRLVYLVGLEQRAGDRRAWALQTVANLAERAESEPFDAVTRDRLLVLAKSLGAADRLPSAEWSTEVSDTQVGATSAKRLRLRLRWKGTKGEWDAPARLTTWIYRREERR